MASSPGSLRKDQVRSVFDNVLDGQSPCLPYRVVPSGPRSSFQIRVPAYAFEVGIYILCDTSHPGLPSHLNDKVMDASVLDHCEWKTGGPTKMSSEDLQKRHCGPTPARGDIGNRGDLWTMVVNGQEDLVYRLLHVRPRASTTAGKESSEGCMKCGRDDDHPSLMECSFCESAHCHTYCTGFASLPREDWFCSKTCLEQHRDWKQLPVQRTDEPRINSGSKTESEDEESENEEDDARAVARQIPTPQTRSCGNGQQPEWTAALRVSMFSSISDGNRKRPPAEAGWGIQPKRSRTTVQQRNESEVVVQPDGVGPAQNPESSVVAGDGGDGQNNGGDEPAAIRAEEVAPTEYPAPLFAGTEGKNHGGNALAGQQGAANAEDPKSLVPTNDERNHGDHEPATQQEEGEAEAARVPDGSAFDPVVIDDDTVVKKEEDEDDASSANGGPKSEPEVETWIYFRLIRYGLFEPELLGFANTNTRNATFSDLRTIVQHDYEQILPVHNAWNFYFPSIGPVNANQETSLGSVVDFFGRVGDGALGDGTFANPFRLGIRSTR